MCAWTPAFAGVTCREDAGRDRVELPPLPP